MADVIEGVAAILAELIQWRHDLHAHPETAFEEKRTSDFVASKLESFGIEVQRGLAGTGIVGVLSNGDGPVIGLRAELDALPMEEHNDFAYRSTCAKRMHACGHDGHMTMLLGAARLLAERRKFRGKVVFIFQPAEENEGGGRVMVEQGLFDRFPIEAVYGLRVQRSRTGVPILRAIMYAASYVQSNRERSGTMGGPNEPRTRRDEPVRRHIADEAVAATKGMGPSAAGFNRPNARAHSARAISLLMLGVFLAAACTTIAHAQAYPTRPVRLIMPYPAGGGSDVVGRLVAQRLSVDLGQPVTVYNHPGAAGLVGTEIAAKAPADGYTLLLSTSTNAINVSLHPKLPYDFYADFEPLVLIGGSLQLLVIHPSIPAKSTQQFVAFVKSRPGQLSYASAGSGSSGHIAMEVLKRAAGLDILHVPHKGGAPALADILGGQVAALFQSVVTAVKLVEAGKLRGLGVTGSQRSVIAPDIPTIASAGYPGFDVVGWFALSVRAGTPKPVVDQLSAAIIRALASKELQERMLAIGVEPMPGGKTPEQFREFLKADIAKWSKMVREAGIRGD